MELTQGRLDQSALDRHVLTAALGPSERLMVTAYRRWILGLRENRGAHWSLMWNEFAGRLGSHDGRIAMAAFFDVMHELQLHARRKLYHHQPCCKHLGIDEVCLLRLLCACQKRKRGLAGRLAEWLVRAEGREQLTEAGERLGAALEERGLCFAEIAPEALAPMQIPVSDH